jgi:hypothetical protein
MLTRSARCWEVPLRSPPLGCNFELAPEYKWEVRQDEELLAETSATHIGDKPWRGARFAALRRRLSSRQELLIDLKKAEPPPKLNGGDPVRFFGILWIRYFGHSS